MKIDVLGVVRRGARPGTRRCDICHCQAPALHECHIRYLADSTHVTHGYWYDLCLPCVVKLQAAPDLPPESEKAAVAFDRLKKQIRSRR